MDVLTEHARVSFAHGYALSGGPLTAEVKAACLVAIAHVREHGTEQALQEAVDLGALSGTWALHLARREAVYATQVAAIVAAWRKLAAKVDLAQAVARFRRAVTVIEYADPEKRHRAAEAAAAAVVALRILVDQHDPDWTAFVDALAAGMTVARAEGVAGAIGIAAARAGVTGIDFQAAYDDALAAHTTQAAATVAADAELAAEDIVSGATTDLTRALLAGYRDDLSTTDWEAAAADAIGDGEDPSAADVIGDVAIGQSFMTGAIGWFLSQAVAEVNFVTQASACPLCESIAAQNPWRIYDCPTPPVHPNCRCSVEPSDTIFGFDFGQYL